jgi:hypothetical protein
MPAKSKRKAVAAAEEAAPEAASSDEKAPKRTKRSATPKKKSGLSTSPAAVARRKVLENAAADTHVFAPATDAELHGWFEKNGESKEHTNGLWVAVADGTSNAPSFEQVMDAGSA